jgi:hypothetical protein
MFLIISPILVGIFLIKNNERLQNTDFHDKFENLYGNLKEKKLTALLYIPIFLIRRVVFVLLIIYFSDFSEV